MSRTKVQPEIRPAFVLETPVNGPAYFRTVAIDRADEIRGIGESLETEGLKIESPGELYFDVSYNIRSLRAEAMVRTFRKVENGLNRMVADGYGSPRTFGEYVARVAIILDVDAFGFFRNGHVVFTGRMGIADAIDEEATVKLSNTDMSVLEPEAVTV